MKKENKSFLKKVWHFIWVEDSLASWIVNVILAFLIVKFIIYPLLGLMLGTSYPVVAVVSGSMEHNGLDFDSWWANNADWYENENFTKEEFYDFSFKNGFNKGDIIVLKGINAENIKRGNVIVYSTNRYKYPIIHRVVNKEGELGSYTIETKGDNNTLEDPEGITEDKLIGKAIFKIPFLGWIKIMFTWMIGG
ncbi:MAG: signal peptidase I [Nanoarchaeota archaeon]|nr:signal peptidase I [Nanoarchaeota archaeon]